MNILLANDDGYDAPGIQILAKRLAMSHNVYILAPSSNRSAVSNHITIFEDSKIIKVDEKTWSCSGMPVDCVNIGLISNMFDFKFDVIIGGINCGANVGTDIIYSGTCAIARQAVLLGVPGIAVSLDPIDWEKCNKEGFKYNALADFTAKNIEQLVAMTSVEYPRVFVNVNAASLDEYKGVKVANSLCTQKYGDHLTIEDKGDYLASVFHFGCSTQVNPAECDEVICKDGYISVSRVIADCECAKIVDGFKFSL